MLELETAAYSPPYLMISQAEGRLRVSGIAMIVQAPQDLDLITLYIKREQLFLESAAVDLDEGWHEWNYSAYDVKYLGHVSLSVRDIMVILTLQEWYEGTYWWKPMVNI